MPTNYFSLLHPSGKPPGGSYVALLQRPAPAQPSALLRQTEAYRERLHSWLDDAMVATLPFPADDGVLARISIHGVPYWFVAMRDIKSELDAYGAPQLRLLRAAMKALGWQERRAIAWGRRNVGFIKRRE
jgi:hypothetical protein